MKSLSVLRLLRPASAGVMLLLSLTLWGQTASEGAVSQAPDGQARESQGSVWRARRAAREVQAAAAASTSGTEARPSGEASPDLKGSRMVTSVLWLSDSAPWRGEGSRRPEGAMAGMRMGAGTREGPPTQRLWLRVGIDPVRSGYAQEDTGTEVILVTPSGKPEGEPLAPSAEARGAFAIQLPVQGFYRVYSISRKLRGEVLNISVAKAEISNFGHGGDVDEQERALKAPIVLESAPLEIVRERKADEKAFSQLKSGDELVFAVLRKGLPVKGARVRLVSHQTWVKEAVSDEQGRVSFQLLRDYFPRWQDFQKRFKGTLLVIAENTVTEAGRFNDAPYSELHYQATLACNYYPSPEDYRSYAWGLGLSVGIVLLLGSAIYLYRRRRLKPFREVNFNDSK